MLLWKAKWKSFKIKPFVLINAALATLTIVVELKQSKCIHSISFSKGNGEEFHSCTQCVQNRVAGTLYFIHWKDLSQLTWWWQSQKGGRIKFVRCYSFENVTSKCDK